MRRPGKGQSVRRPGGESAPVPQVRVLPRPQVDEVKRRFLPTIEDRKGVATWTNPAAARALADLFRGAVAPEIESVNRLPAIPRGSLPVDPSGPGAGLGPRRFFQVSGDLPGPAPVEPHHVQGRRTAEIGDVEDATPGPQEEPF